MKNQEIIGQYIQRKYTHSTVRIDGKDIEYKEFCKEVDEVIKLHCHKEEILSHAIGAKIELKYTGEMGNETFFDIIKLYDFDLKEKIGEETKTLWYEEVYDFFSSVPETITEEMREEIDAGDKVLDINFNHDEKTVSWCFRKGNISYTSTEDVYAEIIEYVQNHKKNGVEK